MLASRRSKKQPRWTYRDRLLLLAWQMYQDSLCKDCGQDRERSMHPDMSGHYEVRELICEACAELERHRKAQKEPDRSRKEYVIDRRPADLPLPEWTPDLLP